jgi:hypothetical protein
MPTEATPTPRAQQPGGIVALYLSFQGDFANSLVPVAALREAEDAGPIKKGGPSAALSVPSVRWGAT